MKAGDLVVYQSPGGEIEYGFVRAVVVNVDGQEFPNRQIGCTIFEVVWYLDGESSREDDSSLKSGQIRVISEN
mgnify:CR=1 FL=1